MFAKEALREAQECVRASRTAGKCTEDSAEKGFAAKGASSAQTPNSILNTSDRRTS